MSQALRCPKSTEPRGEVDTQTGVLVCVAPVVEVMSQVTGSTVTFRSHLLLQLSDHFILLRSGALQMHDLASLHCLAMGSTLSCRFWQVAVLLVSVPMFPHVQMSCALFAATA